MKEFTIIIMLIIAIVLEALWAQYLLAAIFSIVASLWLVAGCVMLFNLFTPKSLRGIGLFLLVVGQIYVWVAVK